MADQKKGVIIAATDGGVAGENAPLDPFQFLVGPTTTNQFNTAHFPLRAIGCLRTDDLRFGFNTSFLTADLDFVESSPAGNDDSQASSGTPNDIRAELAILAGMVGKDGHFFGCPLSVFGHADPVGNDDYNKSLSGRRAIVIYALLIAHGDPALAKELWKQVADFEAWGKDHREMMQAFTGLSGTGDALMQAYMQKLCSPELVLDPKKDFLARGADSGGKGDYQGCSEFNPTLIFSKEKQDKFDQARQGQTDEDKITLKDRNSQNAPNRRVLILIFPKGSKVEPSKWPCPRASEGTAGCKKRFWSDGEKRRSTHETESDRAFEETGDTFACRFYQRISGFSPCERGGVCVRLVGHVFANFDHREGDQNIDTDEDNRRLRILRPGAVVLPNLDIDEDPAAPRKRFTVNEVDALMDDKVNEGDDSKEVTLFKIAEPATVPGNAVRVVLQVDPADAQRVRIWKVPKGKTLKDGVVVIGPTQGNRFVVEDKLKTKVNPRWQDDFFVEGLVLSLDVKRPPSNAAVPGPPGSLNTPVPNDGGPNSNPPVNRTNPAKPMHVARMPNDVWVELIHESASGAVAELKDAALFTIAPWLMLWNTLDSLRLYVVYMMKRKRPEKFQRILSTENHNTVMDVHDACVIAGLVAPLGPDSSAQPPPTDHSKVRSLADAPVYIISDTDALGDRWIQDECEIGYCAAPHRSLHVVMHVKRMGTAGDTGLGQFVVKQMAHSGLGVYNGVARAPRILSDPNARNLPFTLLDVRASSINYGGNLEVSPPILKPTPAITDEFSGPAIKAHPAAPFGKILLGDGPNFAMSLEFLNVLFAQSVQPVLPVDTTWLAVAHVDEIMCIVRANSPKGFSLLVADTKLLEQLFEAVLVEDANATLHASRCNGVITDEGLSKWNYGEEFVDQFLITLPKSAAHLRAGQKMPAIRQRLKVGLDLSDLDIIPIPMSFADVPARLPEIDPLPVAKARTVGIVNMQVVNNVLLVPRPYGPRVAPDKAEKVLTHVLSERFGINAPAVSLPSAGDHFFWARPGEALTAIAMYFARPANMVPSADRTIRAQLIDKLKALVTSNFNPQDPNFNLDDLGPVGKAEVATLQHAILHDPLNNAHISNPFIGEILTKLSGDLHFEEWMRIHIPTDTVDVIEGYLKSVLEPLGNTVRFIDEFEFYHEAFGDIHCGTNVIRAMPEKKPAFIARWWDPGVYDPDRDLTYKVNTPIL